METQYQNQKVLADLGKRLQRIEEKLGDQHPAKNDWLDNQEICLRLHISKRTLDSYRKRGLLPYSKIGGKVYCRVSDIDDYLTTHIVRKEGRL